MSMEKLSPAGVPLVGGISNEVQLVDFIGVPRVLNRYEIVQFTSIIHPSVSIVSILWDFGDGYTSSDLNPTHGYRIAGVFSVILTVFASGGSSISEHKFYYITVTNSEDPVDIDDFSDRATNLLIEEVRKQYGETRSIPAILGDPDYVPPVELPVINAPDPIIDMADRAVNLLIENVRKQYGER